VQHASEEKQLGDPETVLGGEELYDPNWSGVKGVYANNPGITPRYHSAEGRDRIGDDIRVARLYLTGAGTPFNVNNFYTSSAVTSPAQKLFTHGYIGFFINQVTETHQEKSQVVNLNGDNYAAYFTGRSPTVYTFSGSLLNTRQDPWRDMFTELYEKVLRGSKSAQHRHLVQVAYDSKVVTGIITDMTQTLQASNELYAPFSFNMLVKSIFRELPSEDMLGAAFRGDSSLFDKAAVTVAKLDAFGSLTQNAAIAPPPKKKRPRGNKSKVVACGKSTIIGKSGQSLSIPGAQQDFKEACSAQKNAGKVSAKIKKAKKDLALITKASTTTEKKSAFADKRSALEAELQVLYSDLAGYNKINKQAKIRARAIAAVAAKANTKPAAP